MLTEGKNPQLMVSEELSEQELDRLCSLIELLDRWDREDNKEVLKCLA